MDSLKDYFKVKSKIIASDLGTLKRVREVEYTGKSKQDFYFTIVTTDSDGERIELKFKSLSALNKELLNPNKNYGNYEVHLDDIQLDFAQHEEEDPVELIDLYGGP